MRRSELLRARKSGLREGLEDDAQEKNEEEELPKARQSMRMTRTTLLGLCLEAWGRRGRWKMPSSRRSCALAALGHLKALRFELGSRRTSKRWRRRRSSRPA